jgi:hypothetical protein
MNQLFIFCSFGGQKFGVRNNNVLQYDEYPLDAQWVFYLCREMNFCTCVAQSFIKEHPEVIEVSPPSVTRLTSQEKHYIRTDISEAHGEGLVIYN